MPNIQEKDFYLQPGVDSVVVTGSQPYKVYGGESQLVGTHTSGVGIGLPRQNIALFNFMFGLPLFLFLLLFVFIVSFRKSFSNLIISFASFKKFWNAQRTQIWGEVPFFILLFLFSILPLALFLTENMRVYMPEYSEEQFSLIFIPMCAVMGIFMLLRIVFYSIVGWVSREKQLFSDLIYTQLIFFAIMGITIVPIFLARNFLDNSVSANLLFPLNLFLLAIFCLYFFRTIRLFLHGKISFFFWILYFCTLEILPMTVIFKFLEEA